MKTVTVFGGTGFLGRRVVCHLCDHGFTVRVAVRHPERAATAFPEKLPGLTLSRADVEDDASVAQAVAGAWGVVNAVSLYIEIGTSTFKRIHVEAAARVAIEARRGGVARLVHVSGIGADARASSPYIRSRGEGEVAVRAALPEAVIVRPSAMFGMDGGLLAAVLGPLRAAPVFPLFGTGVTRLQPAHVEDVGEAVARIMALGQPAPVYEFGGPRVLAYATLVRLAARHLGRRRVLVPVPFALWRVLAAVAERLPRSPLSSGQVALMMRDNVASAADPGFAALGIVPQDIEPVLAALAAR